MIIRTEHVFQTHCIRWYRMQYKDNLLFAIPNHGKRTNGAKYKREGLISGVPDLFLAVPKGIYSGMFIELKRTPKDKPTSNQINMLLSLKQSGYCCAIISDIQSFISTVEEYLSLKVKSQITKSKIF